MRRQILQLVLFLAGFSLFSSAVAAASANASAVVVLSEELTLSQLADNAYLVTHNFPWPANSLLVRYPGKAIVWVDTPYTNEATKQVWRWLRANLGKEKVIVINTGFHIDNLGGNEFLRLEKVDIFGLKLTKQLLKAHSESSRKAMRSWLKAPEQKKYFDAYSRAKFVPPNQLITMHSNESQVLLDGIAEAYFPGAGHTRDNLVVYFPDKKLLFAGCMVKSMQAENLGFTGDAELAEWPVSLKRLQAKYTDALFVIPGHGPPGGPELIVHTIDLF